MKSLPSKDTILAWLKDNPTSTGKRDIARAFGIKGAGRIELKQMLRELQDEGHIEKRRRRVLAPGHLPPVAMLIAEGPDADGDLFAKPMTWESDEDPPSILVMPKKGDPALGAGDRFLAKLRPVEGEISLQYEARLIKKIGQGARRLLGIFRAEAEGGRLIPVDKKSDKEWLIPPGATDGAKDGELIEAEAIPGPRLGLPRGRVIDRLGDPGAPRQVSLIAMHQHDIPHAFPEDVIAEAEAAQPVGPEGREDLRPIPLVTIDPSDARDHDDAVAAMPDPDNPGGHIVWVAIADVAHYVRPGTKLDREARKRGNSTYFPDRVSPMLPEALSADLCSLHEHVDRPCLAVRLTLDENGQKTAHRFTRAIMTSRASISYEQAQAAADGRPDAQTAPLMKAVITPLWAAYRAAARARDARQPLDLDLPERRVEIGEDGEVAAIRQRDRLDAHRLIEEFMILANVAAAEELQANRRPCLYRVHEEPKEDKIDALRETVETLGMVLSKGQSVRTRHLNDLLRAARETDAEEMVNLQVLRAQTQAYYASENFGHFGLNLRAYAHFTSPIRRYADLIVHRALMRELSPEDIERLDETAKQISQTERRSMEAERDTTDRYLAQYLSGREGATFLGRVSGIARFGLFVKLDDTGADGLIPIGSLGREYFHYDAEALTLTGDRSGQVLAMGMRAEVRLVEATPVTGGLIFELLSAEGAIPPRRSGRPSKATPRRKLAKSRIAKAKAARKARRKS